MTDIFSSLWVVCSHWKFQKEKVHFKYTDDAKKIRVECWTLHALNCRSFNIVKEEALSDSDY